MEEMLKTFTQLLNKSKQSSPKTEELVSLVKSVHKMLLLIITSNQGEGVQHIQQDSNGNGSPTRITEVLNSEHDFFEGEEQKNIIVGNNQGVDIHHQNMSGNSQGQLFGFEEDNDESPLIVP